MEISPVGTVPKLEQLLNSKEKIFLAAENKNERYQEIKKFLNELKYRKLSKKEKGTVQRFLKKTTGYTKGHIKRIIGKYLKGKLDWKKWQKTNAKKIYLHQDVGLLNEVDRAHNWLSGKATKKILAREFYVFCRPEFERLKNISVSHIYRLRASPHYVRLGTKYEKTKNTPVGIGERRKPTPYNQPGYFRVDTVHQGDLNGKKGVYWINIVDEVLQFEFVLCVPEICQKYIKEILIIFRDLCPYKILNFHSDNGSEFINKLVAAFLNEEKITQTKSRPRQHNDNALVESKNGSIIRKQFGHAHIPATQKNVKLLNLFCQNWFIPYLNFHRPCAFPNVITGANGKQKKVYNQKDFKTPFEKLKSLPNPKQFLKSGVTLNTLDKIASSLSDTQFALQMNQNKSIIFSQLKFF